MENIKHINMYMKVKATRTVASFVSQCSVQQYGEKLYTHFVFFLLLLKECGVKMVFLQEYTVPKFDVASKRWGESAHIPFVLVWKNIPCSPTNHSLG